LITKKLVQKISWLRLRAEKSRKKIWRLKKRNYICRPQPRGNLVKKDGAIAQSVEQRTENPCVAGSIPARTTEEKASEKSGAFLLYTLLAVHLNLVH
jgi:hypothetical protein